MTSFYYTRKLIEERIKILTDSISVFEAYNTGDEDFDEDIKKCETELKELKIALSIMKGAETE